MTDLIHYVIVRRDLPLGILAAMITHAAGESAAWFSDDMGGYVTGLPPHTTAVVLEAKDEEELKSVKSYLSQQTNLVYVPIYESGGSYNNQLMSIGIVPDIRTKLGPVLAHLPLLRDRESLDNYDDQC